MSWACFRNGKWHSYSLEPPLYIVIYVLEQEEENEGIPHHTSVLLNVYKRKQLIMYRIITLYIRDVKSSEIELPTKK